MSKVVYISHDGTRHELDVSDGVSLMQAAVSNGIYDIVGDCGGSASCATCHVYVDEAFCDKLPAPTEREAGMLECAAAEVKPNSRLCCQIVMSPVLDGLVVEIPDRQW
ncbi:2Fe-2S iron-sulfur cluster-binding protein [Pseudomonas sp. MYb185]|uniref:2Fe-2S iron-sulfur cluster-binding protein n=1 Tax=Pseudomonas sp. MYb185 TaxID=1848729 RepID=UPI000CFAF775|nr:2Fe-2S iron-sulfur cluster-binding protein [Pseudomonas sp. MYb185]PRB84547.1 ferredoxin [Pseudomonas sp. MYb185]